MLNPAWRPAQADNPALAVIQQHYKAMTESSPGSPAKAINIPVICASTADDPDDDIHYLASALERQLNLPDSNQRHPDERWSLSASSCTALSREPSPDMILVMVDASLDALKQAYKHLKPLQHLRDTRFSVIVHGAKDVESGRRYYRRLAMGSLHFLDLPLLYCGHAPSRGASFSQGLATLAQKVKNAQVSAEPSASQELN